jgi:hypothetical protein|nr:MAG TPA: hypothetical protein [Caudoviricetes sp.]
MYNYLEAMKFDIKDYIKNEVNTSNYSDREELENDLNDILWNEDAITGNASGSYTFNYADAKEYVTDNMNLLAEACKEFGVTNETVGEKFLNEDWEYFDVTIRCYLLSHAISEALDEIDLEFATDEE